MFDINNSILLDRLISREYLAHTLAYQNLVDQSTITVFFNGRPVSAVVHKIQTEIDGLVGYILEINGFGSTPRIEVIWRGTHNLISAHIDLEKDGAGSESYTIARKKIISQINNAVRDLSTKTGGKVIVGVSGHSLGGALAQLCLTDLTGAMVQNITKLELAEYDGFEYKDRNALTLGNILKLELGAFNSTGVSDKAYKNANVFSEYLLKNFKNFKINADYSLNERDGVQQTGKTNIFAKSHFVNLNLFKFNTIPNWYEQNSLVFRPLVGTYFAHTANHSFVDRKNNHLVLKNKNFKIFSNKFSNGTRNEYGAIKIEEELLHNKSWIVNNMYIDYFKLKLHQLSKPFVYNHLNFAPTSATIPFRKQLLRAF